jgi:4-amino-4-deoxy-L-arabinose transferase-like glycosyltransferase
MTDGVRVPCQFSANEVMKAFCDSLAFRLGFQTLLHAPPPLFANFRHRLPPAISLILLGNTLLHFALGWALGLTGDEAHYALYAAHLDLSYYDHPPLVGWIQWPLVALDAPAGLLRLIPEALWVITAALIYAIAQRLEGKVSESSDTASNAGLWAVIAFAVAPMSHILGIGLLPDSLLMTLTAAVLLQTLRMQGAVEVRRLQAWLLLGGLLGLAGLAKYTAIFVAIPVVFCLIVAHGWRVLLAREPWLALILAVGLVLPVFVWNAQHDWISFTYQLHHGAGSRWQASQLGMFALVQGLLYLLLAWGLVGLMPRRAPGVGQQLSGPQWSLLAFFALPFGVLMALSGGGSGLPHWTAPAWVALTPFAGVGLARLWAHGRRRVIWVLGLVQGVFCGLLIALMLSAGPPWNSSEKPPEPINPFTDFYGWDTAAAKAKQLSQTHKVNRLAVQNWTLVSRLAWYARPLPVHVLDAAFDQSLLWSGELPLGADVLLMDWSQMAYQLPVGAGQFQSCTPLDALPVQHWGRPVAHFAFYLCRGWGGKPQPKRQD